MVPRVGVSSLDQVAQEKRGAAIRRAELEGVVDSHLSFAGEDREEKDQRKRKQEPVRVVDGRECHREPDRRKSCIDQPDEGHRPQLHLWGDTERQALMCACASEVECKLSRESAQVERQLRDGGS